VTQFPLPSDGAIYLDIDYDGYVDRVSWGAEDGRSPCYIDIWRLQPVKEKIEALYHKPRRRRRRLISLHTLTILTVSLL
jgi:hypothetical protein